MSQTCDPTTVARSKLPAFPWSYTIRYSPASLATRCHPLAPRDLHNHVFISKSSCAICGKEPAKECARCQSISYCSKECERADWDATHKHVCLPFSEFSATSRPSAKHRRAILFDTNEQNPKLIWLHCPVHEDGYSTYEAPECEPYLGENGSMVQIQNNLRLHLILPNTIRLRHRDAFLRDGSKPNQCIRAISNSGKVPHWRGPVIAYGTHAVGVDQVDCRDLDSVDFRHIVDFIDEYGIQVTEIDDEEGIQEPQASNNNLRDFLDGLVVESMEKRTNTTVSGVRINCLGDVELNKRPKFEQVQVPPTDIIAGGKGFATSDIAGRIGLPVFTSKIPSDPEWAEKSASTGDSYLNNQEATFLHLSCNDKPGEFFGWGWVPMEWQRASGSVLVVRQDKTPLHPLHVEALSDYCKSIQPLFEAALENSPSDKASDPQTAAIRKTVLAEISRADFELTWKRVLERNKDGSQAESPYEVS